MGFSHVLFEGHVFVFEFSVAFFELFFDCLEDLLRVYRFGEVGVGSEGYGFLDVVD